MEYRQYHNLTEAYLSRVNEDTKQQQLDEVVGLAARGLRAAAPIANRIANKINPIIIKNLKPLDNFFEEILLINLISK